MSAVMEGGQRDDAVIQALDDLTSDFERTGRPLEIERIERLASVRQLRFGQVEEILDALFAAGVPVATPANDAQEALPEAEEVLEASSPLDEEQRCRALLDHPLLTAKAETELGRSIAAGVSAKREIDAGNPSSRAFEAVARGEKAREKLTIYNLRLVWTWSCRYAAMTGLDRTDLFQEGTIGLIRAVDKYDPEIGFRFSTYAVWWIRQAVGRAVADRGRTIRLPNHVHEQLMRLARATRLLWRELGAKPSLAKLAAELASDREHVAFLQGLASLVPISLDAPTLDGEGEPLVETLAAEQDDPASVLECEEVAQQVREAVASLPRRMRTVIALRNGLGGREPETLEYVGQSYGLTRERVRQIENKAMARLRNSVPARLGLPPISEASVRVDPESGVDDGDPKGEVRSE